MTALSRRALNYRSDAEIQDWVRHDDGTTEYRRVNEAANNEVRRRGLIPTRPSGEVPPDVIVWVNTLDGSEVIEPAGGALMRTFSVQTAAATPSTTATAALFGSMVLSQPTPADLVIYRGDTGRFRVTVTDPDGTPVDVSGATWICEIRVAPDDTTVMATLDVQAVAGDTSSIDVILTAAQSASLTQSGVWDLQMTMGTEVQTLMAGKATVTKDVSRP